MFIDSKVDFNEHIKSIKLVNLLLLFASSEILNQDYLFHKSINLLLDLTHPDYGDIIYEKDFLGSFQQKIECVYLKRSNFRGKHFS